MKLGAADHLARKVIAELAHRLELIQAALGNSGILRGDQCALAMKLERDAVGDHLVKLIKRRHAELRDRLEAVDI